MPLFMDIHVVPGATPDALAQAHAADLDVQHKHGVECLRYWFNEPAGKVFCLFDAPNAEAANAVHREAHGLLAEKIIEVDEDMAAGLLGQGEVNAAGAVLLPNPADGRDPGIRSVLFTDIVGSTELTQRLGDVAAMELVNAHDAIVRGALAAHDGREVKHTGDGIMAAFVSAACAMRCAARIQSELAARRAGGNGGHPLNVRIGAAAGQPVEQNNDLFGSTVQLAARLCARCEPGQVLVSVDVAELCAGEALDFDDHGEAALKGFPQPVRVHALRLM